MSEDPDAVASVLKPDRSEGKCDGLLVDFDGHTFQDRVVEIVEWQDARFSHLTNLNLAHVSPYTFFGRPAQPWAETSDSGST